jgi:hypothetical protein
LKTYPSIQLFIEAFPEYGRNAGRFELVLVPAHKHFELVAASLKLCFFVVDVPAIKAVVFVLATPSLVFPSQVSA